MLNLSSLSNGAEKNMPWLSVLVVRCVQDRDSRICTKSLSWNATNAAKHNLGDALKQIFSSEVVLPP